ncbi:hypothetical protein [Methanococcus maripaludis]|uniref:Uncharacterized protein n=1 Tax=Methanococcus maripaludis TaxID=39152 RepID=A0A8T4H0R2_METMI|nr:hypothetical protein [Methanococcus maripaludis]MBM7408794.1 hypothetical protein [Methanococcus maripaludis]MBP2219037.1 hypothetical protein [Methanococcus maripaludis]
MEDIKKRINEDPQMVDYLKIELNQNYEMFRYLDSKINKSLTFIITNWLLYIILGFFLNSSGFLEVSMLLKVAIVCGLLPLLTIMPTMASTVIHNDLMFYKRTILTLVSIEQVLDKQNHLITHNHWKNANLYKYTEKFVLLYEINMVLIMGAVFLTLMVFEEVKILAVFISIIYAIIFYNNVKIRWKLYAEEDNDVKYEQEMEDRVKELENRGRNSKNEGTI